MAAGAGPKAPCAKLIVDCLFRHGKAVGHVSVFPSWTRPITLYINVGLSKIQDRITASALDYC